MTSADTLNAGFARAVITPPVGSRMEGWAMYRERPFAEAIHDDLRVRALYLRQAGDTALLLAYDALFFSRENADRLKAAVGRRLDLAPRRILIHCTHTHSCPHTSNYTYHYDLPPDWAWLERLEAGTLTAAEDARAAARPVTLRAGLGRTRLPLNRRKPDGRGGVTFAPHPEGIVCDALPVCLLEDGDRRPVCLLFSVSCHPSTARTWGFSAEYPGVACAALDRMWGAPVSLFLQGAGGDAKPWMTGEALGTPEARFKAGDWDDIRRAGEQVAGEVEKALASSLRSVPPALRAALVEMAWPLQAIPDRAAFERERMAASPTRREWAERHLRLLDRGLPIHRTASLLAQEVRLGDTLRLIAVEGELTGELGLRIIRAFPSGVTFPLGYSNGMGLYLPSSRMIAEGGYETDSYDEYGYAAPLAPGVEALLDDALRRLALE